MSYLQILHLNNIHELGPYDVIGKITFGQPTGYLKAGKDFNNLIKRQQQFFEHVNLVGNLVAHPETFSADSEFRFLKCPSWMAF